MVATVATVAYLGLEARAVEVQVQLAAGPSRFRHRRPARQGGRRKPRAGARGAVARSASRFRPSGSRSTCRPPTCPRKGRISTCRSRLCLLAAIGATDAESLSHYVAVGELSLDGRIARLARRAARRASCQRAGDGADLPGRPGQRGGLGGQCRGAGGARPAGAAVAFQGHAAAAPARAGRGRAGGRRARPEAGQGPGSRQARAGDRRGRRSQSADERAAGRGKVAARRLPARHPAAARAVRGAGSVDGRQRRRRAGWRAAAAPPAVSRAAP